MVSNPGLNTARRFACAGVAAGMLLGLTSVATAQTASQILGYDALMARLGVGNFPTGANVVVAQVEAPESPGNYGPNQANGEFVGKTFTAMSGAPGLSVHASFVGVDYYGTSSSISPGVTTIYLYEANDWAGLGYLRPPGGGVPLTTPGNIKIINNSWIGNAAGDNDILRRADYAANRDEVLMFDGVPNSAPPADLMYQAFNCISVGLTSGTHLSGTTSALLDSPGRMKPDIVAPGPFTSYVTPYVAGEAADLVQTARTVPALMSNPNAQKTEVLKAVILAGGQKSATWTNNPSTSGSTRGTTATPLDAIYGVGTANVNTSHLILTGLEQNGSATVPTTSNATFRGWDYVNNLGMVANRYYRFHLSSTASRISIVAAWNRYVEPNFSNFLNPDFNLQLWKTNASSQLISLVGSGGVGVFAGGNVVSQSAVDNVELLNITGLTAGDYVLNLTRNDNVNLIWDVAVAWLLPKTGDINGDGLINIDDLVAVITAWGACADPQNCPEDVNGSGAVNIDDLVMVITNWG